MPAHSKRFLVAATCLVALGALLRLPGLFADFWLDEIWSWRHAGGLSAPWQVFTAIHHDSNHWLNTLWIYLLGAEAPVPLYRVPSYLAGVGTVVVAGLLGRRWGELEALLAMGLVAVCYPLVFYASEARGYALMLFWGLLSLWCLLRYAEAPRRGLKVAYWACSILAFLSHLTYLHLFAANILWAFYALRRDDEQALPDDLVRLHVVQVVFLGLLFLVDLRLLAFGGGPEYSLLAVLVHTASLALGGPASGWLAGAAALLAGAALVAQLVLLRRDGRQWLLFASAIVFVPAALLLAARPAFLFPRYFLVGIALLQLLLAGLLARGLRAGRAGQVAAVAGLLLLCVAHGLSLDRFWRQGRGQYRAALEAMLRASTGGPIEVGSDFDFRNRLLVEFHAARIPTDRIRYLPQEGWPAGGAEWWIAQTLEPELSAPASASDPAGHRYDLVGEFPTARLSGARWFLYRRVRN